MPRLTLTAHNRKAERAFITRLRSVLDLKQMTQADLGRRVGASQATVSEWFSTFTMPKGQFLLKMPDALGVNGHWLMTGEGSMNPPGGARANPEDYRKAVEVLGKIERAVQAEAREIVEELEGHRPRKTSGAERRRGLDRRTTARKKGRAPAQERRQG